MADTISRCRPLLGTFVSIEASGCLPDAVDHAFSRIAHVHNRMSFHSATSDLARLRTAPWGSAVPVSTETAIVLRYAERLYTQSAGLFDVTIASRLVAAGFLPRPSDVDLRTLTGRGADIEVGSDNIVRCHRPLLIDLGGIAKGYAVDLALSSLRDAGATGGIVDAGGDLRLFGPERKIGIRGGDGAVRYALEVCDLAVATSSNRHARRRLRGKVTTPHMGRESQPVLIEDSVTIVADSCMTADAFTKIAIADPECAARLLPLHNAQQLKIPLNLAQAA